jgi:hypothetical protein
MRAIDMLCLMLSPMAAGFLMTYAGMLPAVLAIAAYALVVWAPECVLLRVAHRLSPQLRCAASLFLGAACTFSHALSPSVLLISVCGMHTNP